MGHVTAEDTFVWKAALEVRAAFGLGWAQDHCFFFADSTRYAECFAVAVDRTHAMFVVRAKGRGGSLP